MLKYPPYDQSEYNCLKCPEAVADFYVKLESLEGRKAELELARRDLERESQCSLLSIKETVVAEVNRYLGDQDPEYRRKALGKLLPNLKTCLQRGPGIMNARLQASALEVLRHYATLDVQAFQDDIDSFIDATDDGKSLREQLRSLNGKIGYAESQMSILWKDYEKLFHQVPMMWRDWKFKVPMADGPEKESAVTRERRNMAERVLRSFVRDWKERCKHFDKPVSVTGVGIHTMPAHKRRVWDAAYDKLGLKQVPKQPYFKFVASYEKDLPEETPRIHNSMFTPQGVEETADAEVA